MDNKDKILEKIFEKPTYHYHIRELARETNLNPNTIINISKVLEGNSLIKKKKRKHIVEIFANIEDKNFIREKKIYNLNKLYSSGLVDFLINFYSNPKAIIVIGSFSRGEDIETSDIDIVVISSIKKIPDLSKFEKKIKRNIHLMALNYSSISNEFYTNLINGIVLYGYLQQK